MRQLRLAALRSRTVILLIFCCVFGFCLRPSCVLAQASFEEIKGKHFIVFFSPSNRSFARRVLNSAESYYRKIGDTIGYTKYANFWTWEERVRILVFPNQKSFMQATGQPLWSLGYASRDSYVFRTRAIVTYKQEIDFIDGVLPHEIGHLVTMDFFSNRGALPDWMSEGISQLFEKDKVKLAMQMMRVLVAQGKYLPFRTLMYLPLSQLEEPLVIKLFYAQSVTVLKFFINHYGQEAFKSLCRFIRDGEQLENALRKASSNQIQSLQDFERKWLTYIRSH